MINGAAVAGVKYRSKIIRVEAWQWCKGHVPPTWVLDAAIPRDGRTFYKRGAVNAVEPNQGDWIVRDASGVISVFTADEFQGAFELDV